MIYQILGKCYGWEDLKEIYKANELSKDKLLYEIAFGILDKDLYYQGNERKNRKEYSDPHASHIQLYIFGGKRLQSPEYANLYNDLYEFLNTYGVLQEQNNFLSHKDSLDDKEINTLRETFSYVTKAWELNHIGQKFNEKELQAIM